MRLDYPGLGIRLSHSIFTMADSKAAIATSSPYSDTNPDLSHNPSNGNHIDMERYKETVPLWKRVWQHSLTQMMLLSVQAFCGPAMSDAITGMCSTTTTHLEDFTPTLISTRARWWWSRNSSGVEYLYCNYICPSCRRYVSGSIRQHQEYSMS